MISDKKTAHYERQTIDKP